MSSEQLVFVFDQKRRVSHSAIFCVCGLLEAARGNVTRKVVPSVNSSGLPDYRHGKDNRLQNVEPQAEPSGLSAATLADPLRKGLKSSAHGHRFRNGFTIVVHIHDDPAAVILVRDNRYQGVRSAVVERVAEEFREYLFEAIRIPRPDQRAATQLHRARGVRCPELLDDFSQHRA